MRRHRKWPNTVHWQRYEAAFRTMHGGSWRRYAAAGRCCSPRDVRALVDTDLSATAVMKMNAFLADLLRQHAASLHRRADEVSEQADAVLRAIPKHVETPVSEEWLNYITDGMPPALAACCRDLYDGL